MRVRDVVGRRIVAVRQARFYNEHTCRWDVSVSALELDNGTRILLNAAESVDSPYVTASLWRAPDPVASHPVAGEPPV